jgi:hypothetical protein
MKVSIPLGFCVFAGTLILSASAFSVGLTPAQIQQFEEGADTDVIVILRDQMPGMAATRGSMGARASALAAAQTPILSELQQARATKVHSFGLINALATRISKAEVARLSAHPLVKAVVPDMPIRAITHSKAALSAGSTSAAAANGARLAATPDAINALCPANPAAPLLEPEALQLTNTAFADPSRPQAHQVLDGAGKPVTGVGVKVAFIADGLDPNLAGFKRADGTGVFFDYQDFSGDPAGTPTEGAEAFGDASSIAAQDRPTFDISLFVNPSHPLPPGCNIRIRGIAPGASLAGLKVFSSLGLTTTSTFVQAIEWAVAHDQVDVINESFGGNPFPDNDNDPISLANNAAVNAGVTVVVSTGDAGTAGTLGSPSTDTDVIAVGGTTSYRLYAQTTMGAAQFSNGFISNNISPLSSGGFAQTRARTVDVVAPGDLGWALCSTDRNLFTGCADLKGAPTPIQDFGGTSESSPLTAGEAALVIQAYRSTHRGIDPTPGLVKRIIMSTATDLGAPSSEQGAGLINSLAAVYAALSVDDSNGRPRNQGQSVLVSPTAANVTDLPNRPQIRFFTVTNTGTSTQHLAPSLQRLGAPLAGETLTLNLNPATDPTFLNTTGSPRSYITRTFNVPAGAQHLDAAIAVQVTPSTSPITYITLIDPAGRLASYSIPQGFGSGYGHVDVVNPAAGQWEAIIYTRPPGLAGSYTGPVKFTWAAERYTTLGAVFPAHLDLPAGASGVITAVFAMPSKPGDVDAAIRFGQGSSGGALQADIPVTLRALVAVGANGGSFTGTLTGGNGRAAAGPTQTFAFDVPFGARNMGLDLDIADSGYLLEGLLVDPQGMQLSVQPNLDPSGQNSLGSLQLFRFNPQPGRWRFVLLQNFTSSGNQTSLPFSARISFFNTAQVATANLPNSPHTRLSASGPPVTIPVHVTNNGTVSQWYFTDARLSKASAVQLATPTVCATDTLQGTCELAWVPPQVSAVRFLAQSSAPINMDAFNDAGFGVGATGSPDLWAKPVGPNTIAASLFVPEVPYGPWILVPSLIGPYGPDGAPTTVPVTASAVALMQPFDGAVSASSGNAWADLVLGTNTFNPLVLGAGESGTINITITPDPSQAGKTVNGFLYLDTFNNAVGTGDEVARIPYSYTVAP